MRLSALAAALIVCLTAPAAPLAAQEAYAWVYDAHYPIDRAQTALNLVASQPGLGPDTSAGRLPGGLIWARCAPGGASGDVVLRFEAYPVSGIPPGATELPFQIDDGAGTLLILASELVNRNTDEPVGGMQVTVALDSAELAMLATAPVLSYGIVGYTDFQYPFDLSGNQDLVTRFIEDCGDLVAELGAGPGAELGAGPGAGQGAAPGAGGASAPRPLVPDVGPALSGHVWSRFTQTSPDPFQAIVQVFYAVPETDDVLVFGECVIGAQGPLVALSASADIEGLSDGAPADLRFTTQGGRSIDVPGSVIGQFAEVGISGIEIVLEMSDPAWLVIAGDETLRIERVGGQGGFTLTGNGPNTIGTFLSDCAEIDTLSAGAGQAPSAPIGAQPGFLSCEAFGRVSSRDTATPQVINFINESGGFRSLIWIDPNGQEVNIAGLNPGEATAFTTDPGHVWMATDGPGDCREMIQPTVGQTDYRLTVPN